jgi:S1-C subfamily serine protease
MTLVPPAFFDAVVAIGEPGGSDDPTRWIATGFLYGKSAGGGTPDRYHPFLVTNRHVVEGRKVVKIRFNPVGTAAAKEYDAQLVDVAGLPMWCGPTDKDADVAVVPIDYERLQRDGIATTLFLDGPHAATRAKMQSMGIAEGDFVYVLGFPFGDVGGSRTYVIVRSGSIARVGDTLSGIRRDFLIDVPTFPGNSGGPVVSKPEVVSIQGTPASNKALLIGITAAAISFPEVAISQQTGRPRVTFEENSGLSVVYPIDFIDDAITRHMAGSRGI